MILISEQKLFRLLVFERSLSIDYLNMFKIARPPNLNCENVQVMVFKNMNIHFLTFFSEATSTLIITIETDLCGGRKYEQPRNILFLFF